MNKLKEHLGGSKSTQRVEKYNTVDCTPKMVGIGFSRAAISVRKEDGRVEKTFTGKRREPAPRVEQKRSRRAAEVKKIGRRGENLKGEHFRRSGKRESGKTREKKVARIALTENVAEEQNVEHYSSGDAKDIPRVKKRQTWVRR